MSVPVFKRKESEIEYLDYFRQFAVDFIKGSNHWYVKPKKTFAPRLDQQVLDIYNLLIQANSIYVNSLERKNEKLRLLEKAKMKLQAFVSELSIAYEIYPNELKDTLYLQNACDKLDKEYTLINGVIKYTKNAEL